MNSRPEEIALAGAIAGAVIAATVALGGAIARLWIPLLGGIVASVYFCYLTWKRWEPWRESRRR